jgi:Niemann-Pick C1 protein
VAQFIDSLDMYSELSVGFDVYFRNINQSDPDVQQDMRDYVTDLMKVPYVGEDASVACWVFDFPKIRDDPEYAILKNLTFNAALSLALEQPAIREAYGDQFVRDEDGNIVASKCFLGPKNLDLDIVQDQIDLLEYQRVVSREYSNLVNRTNESQDMSFFTFDAIFSIWEFYTVAIDELIFTTIAGVVAVCLVGFILIGHWSATAFVLPMILVLYVDLLGTIQFAGLHINVVTYVTLVISIGLLVDFLMHIMLRYYESPGETREAKVKDTLETMGASIVVGGSSTFLAMLCLAFSTSLLIRTVFIAFLAIVVLGVAHGLILLPVILSIMGPVVCVKFQTGEYSDDAGGGVAKESSSILDFKVGAENCDNSLRDSERGSSVSVSDENASREMLEGNSPNTSTEVTDDDKDVDISEHKDENITEVNNGPALVDCYAGGS